MKCWKCGVEQSELKGILPFRAECEKCHAWLHCCCNCKFYKPGLPNDCMIPGTDSIADRSGANFCEEFKELGKRPEKPPENEKKKFEDLFKE